MLLSSGDRADLEEFCSEHFSNCEADYGEPSQRRVHPSRVADDVADLLLESRAFVRAAETPGSGEQSEAPPRNADSGGGWTAPAYPDKPESAEQTYLSMMRDYMQDKHCDDPDDFMCQSSNEMEGMHFMMQQTAMPLAGVDDTDVTAPLPPTAVQSTVLDMLTRPASPDTD